MQSEQINIQNSKITIHMVSSLDGFIAKKDGSVQWMHSKDTYEKGHVLTDSEMHEFLAKIDCYLLGSKTYEQALNLGWPYGDTPVSVLTNRKFTDSKNHVEFISGDLTELVHNLKLKYTNIWAVGGAMLTKELIRLDLADEIVISIIPILLGEGVLFFDMIGVERSLHLNDVRAYKDGMVELSYSIIK